jgi:hypothetical protein
MNENRMTNPVATPRAKSQSLESPLQGNLHGGFGGGSEETTFGKRALLLPY